MASIVVTVDRTYPATVEDTFAALADYAGVRPRILPPQMSDFAVLDGGTGAGTRFTYRLQATEKRVRHVTADVTAPEAGRLVETDSASSLRVQWDVAPAGEGARASVRVTWDGASGIGGFFERRFAPAGIRRIYGDELDRLGAVLAGH